MQSVKVIYGVASGDRLGGRLRRELRHAGFTIAKKSDDADIIVAHSAGCFWLQDTRQDQKLMIIDPPYWPGRTVRDRAKEKSDANFHYRRYDYSHRLWLTKNLWGFYYLIRDMKRTVHIAKRVKDFDLPSVIGDKSVLLVRNKLDSWCTPDLDYLKHNHRNLKIVELPGEHDDWFFNPKPYVDLLQSITWKET